MAQTASLPRSAAGPLLACLALAVGCLSGAPPQVYQPTEPIYLESQRPIPDGRPQLEVGRRLLLLDALNHYIISLPGKLILLNWQLQDHRLPERERAVLERYLAINGMTSVKIRHNQYAPLGELRRLWRNSEVGVGYRATLGVLTWLQYTLLPDRLFGGSLLLPGGDHYNPFTNSVNVYSSDLAVLLHEAGHAKDFARRTRRGGWALLRLLPGLPLLQEANASIDAVRFLGCIEDSRGELEAYPSLMPAYATYVANGSAVLFLPMVVAGHVVGRRKASARREVMASRDPAALEQAARWRSFQPPSCRESAGGESAGAQAEPPADSPRP